MNTDSHIWHSSLIGDRITTLSNGHQRLWEFFFLLIDRDRPSLCKSVCISLPGAGISLDHGMLLCRIGHGQILAFSGKTFRNVTSYIVLASNVFLQIQGSKFLYGFSNSLADYEKLQTRRRISLQNRAQF